MSVILISIAVFVMVIVVHEMAHAYTAYLLGDTTAKEAGRLTFNPLSHADPVGTVILPALLVLSRSPVVFGWAKPVPVDPSNFRNPRRGMFLTGAAGPFSNFVLAGVFAAVLRLSAFPPYSLAWTFLWYGVVISLVLGIFNLMPVPPLDGANMLFSLLPASAYKSFTYLEKYGFVLIIILLYLGLFDRVIMPLTAFFAGVLLGSGT